MADTDRPYRAGYPIISGVGAKRIFAALLDLESFPEWAIGVGARRADGREISEIVPSTKLTCVLRAEGLWATWS